MVVSFSTEIAGEALKWDWNIFRFGNYWFLLVITYDNMQLLLTK